MSTKDEKEPRSWQPSRLPEERPGQVGGKRARNRALRTAQLCEAALPLFLSRGVNNVSIEDITRAAGVAKGSFYRYFEHKGALVAAIIATIGTAARDALAEAVEEIPKARSSDELNGVYLSFAFKIAPVILNHRETTLLYLQEKRSPAGPDTIAIRELSDDIADLAQQMTHAARERGLLRAFEPRLSSLFVIGAVEELAFRKLSGEDLGDPTTMATALMSLVIDGLRAG